MRKQLFTARIPRKDEQYPFYIKDFTTFYANYSYIHRHPEWEICYCRDGNGSYFINDREYPISAGDLFIVNGNEYHQPIYSIDDNRGAIVVYFAPEYLGPDTYTKPWAHYFLSSSQFNLNCLGHQLEMIELVEKMNEEFRSDSPHWAHYCQGILSYLLTLIAQHLEQTLLPVNFQRNFQQRQKFYPVIETIKNRLSEPIDASELYTMAGLSKSQFSVRFKQVFGLSLQEYILKERINRAVALLRGSSLNITEIAYDCGFNSSSYFNNAFKKFINISPTEFRKS